MAKKSGSAALPILLVLFLVIIPGAFVLFLIFCLVATACIVGPLVALYFAIKDNNTKETNIDPEFSLKDYGKRVITDSLDDTVDTEKINFAITEDDMDNMLAIGISKLEGVNNVINKAYMQINGNEYIFFVDVDLKIEKTRLKITTNLSTSSDGKEFVFSINDISIGKIPNLDKGAKFILKYVLSEEQVNQTFENIGLSIHYNSEDMTLRYAKENIMKDINKLAGDSSDNTFMDIFDTLMEQGLVEFTTDTNDFFNAYVDLSKVQTNQYVTDTPTQLKIGAADVTNNVKLPLEKLVNEGKINPEEQDLKSVYEYLFGGYDYIKGNDDKVNLVKSIDMSSIGIASTDSAKENYKGFDISSGDNDLKEKMAASIDIPSLIAGNTELCSLNEDDINSYVSGRSVVGYTYLLHRPVDEEHYKINYITIDNFYCNIYKQGVKNIADFICKININGYHTSLVFNSEVPGAVNDDNRITFYVGDVLYGNINAEKLKDKFFGIISQALDGGDNSIQANKTDYSISFDFNTIIQDARQQTEDAIHLIPGFETWSGEEYFKGSNIQIDVEGANREAVGKISLSLKEGISYLP